MPLFSKDQLAGLVGHLQRRNVLLRHACQLKDFESYLKLGGVPSRKTLAGANLPFTEFQTDRRDLVNNVWDKVFFNFSDFGQVFAQGGPWTPNPYGPIVLKFDPSALLEAGDCCVSLRSAGGPKFNRQIEGIEADRISEIFLSKPENSNVTKSDDELRTAFSGYKVKGSPELNCVVPRGIVSFAQLKGITVDPYEFADGRSLHSFVRGACDQNAFRTEIVTRFCSRARTTVYSELRILAAGSVKKLDEVIAKAIAPETKQWAESVLKWDKKSFQFKRFSDYLRRGTVHHVEGGAGVGELLFEIGSAEVAIAVLEISPPHFVSTLLATTCLQERIRNAIVKELVGRSGRMDSADGTIEGEISFAEVDSLRFDGFDGEAERWSCDIVGSADVQYNGLLADGEDAADDIAGRVTARVTLTFPKLTSEDLEETAEQVSIDEVDLDEWPSA